MITVVITIVNLEVKHWYGYELTVRIGVTSSVEQKSVRLQI